MEKEKFNFSKIEEKILHFWKKNHIFEKTVESRQRKKKFVFYDGPPFATGLPHYGHILASAIKDLIPRYFTMRGYFVPRRWGWDCHGLPIENLVEEKLKIQSKSEIEKIGIKKFNQEARDIVLKYVTEWRKTIDRIGRFVDFENSYKTMDVSYMESIWWAFKELAKKDFIYQDSRISLYCPRCATPLSNHEIALDNSYKDIEDTSIYVKFSVKNEKNTYFLAWTTTPWTLPGNTALAVNPNFKYIKAKIGKEYFILAENRVSVLDKKNEIVKKYSGKELIGLEYEPLFKFHVSGFKFKVVGADFVSGEEGTGIVHIAPAFGEEDFQLGKKEKLPTILNLDDEGKFLPETGFLAGLYVREANPKIIKDLEKRKLLYKQEKIVHSYPFCWRCETPLIYKIQPAWFLKVSALKDKMLKLNKSINWRPAHLKEGRFQNNIETAPDWNLSRSRYWGTPLPIWQCLSCKKNMIVGSINELEKKRFFKTNRFFILRHGEAFSNLQGIISSEYTKESINGLTNRGEQQIKKVIPKIKKLKIDLIYVSDFTRTGETAEILNSELGLEIKFDTRLRELNHGVFHNQKIADYYKFFNYPLERFNRAPAGAETLHDLKKRMFNFIKDINDQHRGKKILIVSHGDPLWILEGIIKNLSEKETLEARKNYINPAELREIRFLNLPYNDDGELDLHRPFIDEIFLKCQFCGQEAKRIPDVFDCWFESGAMPFAEKHYPFENKKKFQDNFPADFISEYIAQTRGWFYALHVLSSALFSKPAFKNVVTTGTILSEDGEKFSKSRKNFPDPWLLFEKYGVDSLRYYLMSSPVMLGENINFSEKEVQEIYRKFILTLWNTFKFHELYKHETRNTKHEILTVKHILDKWILARLNFLIQEITEDLDSYDITKAVRSISDFVQNLSLWYLRRSRERIKTGEGVLEKVLLELSKIIAPVTPFLAEAIYQELPSKAKISVHLEDWPRVEKKYLDIELLKSMEQIRNIVNIGHKLRAEAGIKVRQPLAKLEIKNQKSKIKNKELLDLIKEELNVKEIVFGNEFKLDTEVTPELKQEGILREIIRIIQNMRKEAGLKPQQKIFLTISAGSLSFPKNFEQKIKTEVNVKEIYLVRKESEAFLIEREFELDGENIWIGLRAL